MTIPTTQTPRAIPAAGPERTWGFPEIPIPKTPRAFRVSFWICIVIAIGAVARRAIVLGRPVSPSAPPELGRLDAYFQTHAALTYTHIFTALAFVCLLPLVFWSRTRQSGAVQWGFYGLGAAVGLTAYAMSTHDVGGWVERAAVLLFNTLFLACLAMSLSAWRSAGTDAARPWTLRAAAILLGIATTRPVMGIFFATSPLTHWTPRQFFGPAFWIGFSINTVAMELWLRRRALRPEGGPR